MGCYWNVLCVIVVSIVMINNNKISSFSANINLKTSSFSSFDHY